jgi:hypothetical protein
VSVTDVEILLRGILPDPCNLVWFPSWPITSWANDLPFLIARFHGGEKSNRENKIRKSKNANTLPNGSWTTLHLSSTIVLVSRRCCPRKSNYRKSKARDQIWTSIVKIVDNNKSTPLTCSKIKRSSLSNRGQHHLLYNMAHSRRFCSKNMSFE